MTILNRDVRIAALFGKTYIWQFINGRWSLLRIAADWPA